MPSCIISSLTSTVMFSGMSPGSTSISIVAVDEVDDASLLLDALGLALEDDGHRDGQRPIHRHLVEVGVEQLVIDRIELVLLHEHPRVTRPRDPGVR